MFMLRSVNTIDHQEPLLQFDSIIRGALSAILGSPLTDDQWCQASLPTAMGGLGLRCAVDHAPVAHAVSLIAAQPLLDGLLGEDVEEFSLPQPLLDTISAQIGEDTTVETLTGVSQKKAFRSKLFTGQHLTNLGEAQLEKLPCTMYMQTKEMIKSHTCIKFTYIGLHDVVLVFHVLLDWTSSEDSYLIPRKV